MAAHARRSAINTVDTQSMSTDPEEGKANVATMVKRVAILSVVIPLGVSITVMILNYHVDVKAFGSCPQLMKEFNLACSLNRIPQTSRGVPLCANIRSRCQAFLFEEGKPIDEVLSQEEAEQCQPRYHDFLKAERQELYDEDLKRFLLALAFVVVVPCFGYLGADKDSQPLIVIYACLSALGVPFYIALIVCFCQCHLVVHLFLYGAGGYFGFVLQDRQRRCSVQMAAPFAQTQVSLVQPGIAMAQPASSSTTQLVGGHASNELERW